MLGNIILGVLAIIEFFITLFTIFNVSLDAEYEHKNENNFILSSLGNFIKKLFVGKNLFGIIIALFIFILLIPSFLLLLICELFMWIVYLLFWVWSLGNKNNNLDK